MKAALILLLILFSSYGILLSQTDKTQEQANKFFTKQIRQAHPEPDKTIVPFQYLVPVLSPGEGFSNFLNISTTVDETGQYKMQNESSIAVNPTNKQNLIASAVDYRDTSATWVYVSQDGGASWVNHKLGRPYAGWTASNDPSVAFGNDGTGYLVVGGFGERSNGSTQAQIIENGIFLARTTDNGNTWQSHIPVIVHRGEQTIDSTFEDKYYIWSDNSLNSPNNGNLYIPWKRVWAKDSATQIVISKSTDKGSTWSAPVPVSPRLAGSSEDTTYGQSFPLAVTGDNGEIYVVWNNGIEHAVGFARSTDGGNTFSSPRIIQRYNIFGITTEIEKNVWRHAVKGTVRAEAYPSLVADITSGPRRGWLYLTWAADNIPNIYFSRSTDKGNTWSSPVIVHSDTTNDQLWQWIALDPSNGNLAVMYLDSRDDPKNLLTSTYVSYSSDGGTTWIDRKAADISGDLRRNPFNNNSFAGDYSGCAFFDGVIYPSWIDMRTAESDIFDSDVYTALVNINLPMAPENFDAITIPEKPDEILLKWNKTTQRSFGQPLDFNSVKYLLKRDDSVIAKMNGDIETYTDTGLEKFRMYKYSIAVEYSDLLSGPRRDSAWAGGSKEPGIPDLTSYERNTRNVKLSYKIPSKRLDGITPFVNPKSLILLRDNDTVAVKNDLSIIDTGTVIELNDVVENNGFYYYKAFVKDSYGNSGPFSEAKLIYAGDNLTDYSDDFNDSAIRNYLNQSGWGLTSTFSRTGNALTDSPSGDYRPLVDSSIVIFPYEGRGEYVSLSFWHSVFVQNRDSAIVEYSDDGRNTWKMITYFDKEMYAPWNDGIKSADDWKFERFNIKAESSAIYFRFRLRSNATKNDDGWYIDDLSFSTPSSVDEIKSSQQLIIYPNPAGKFINIVIAQNLVPDNYELFNVFGDKLAEGQVNISEKDHVTIDITNLQAGFYTIVLKSADNGISISKFIKM